MINQSGIAHLLLIVIVFIGIALGIILVQNPQIFRPKAEETLDQTAATQSKVNDAAFEQVYNPFGDPWALKKASNPNIPISLSTGCYRDSEKAAADEIPDREAEYLAKSNAPVIYIDCAVVQDENYMLPKLDKLKSLIKKVKAINPNIKLIGYLVLQEGQPVSQLVVKEADAGNATYESFLVHKKGLAPTKENRLHGRPDHPEWGYTPIFDITNANYRNFAVPKIAAAINTMGLDGVMIDSIGQNTLKGLGLADFVDESKVNGWAGAQAQFIGELKAQLGADSLLFANVRLEETEYLTRDLFAPGRLDGILLEDPIGPEENDFVPGNGRFEKLKEVFSIAQARDKYVLISTNTNVNCKDSGPNCFSTTNEAEQRRYAGYFLSAFLNVFTSPKQMMVHYTPIKDRSQFASETFFKEWDLPIGSPLSASEMIGNGILLRKFQNAYVVLNTTYNQFQLPNGELIPAKSGMIFMMNEGRASAEIHAGTNAATFSIGQARDAAPSLNTAFSLKTISASCAGAGKPQVQLEWTPLQGDYEYKIVMREAPHATVETEIGRTSGTSFLVDVSKGLQSGKAYGFVIAVTTPEKQSFYSDNGWSDGVKGPTAIPTCN